MRIRFVVAYNGSSFLGSQIQSTTKNTVLGQIEHIFKSIGIDSRVVASGRTDSGVHAIAQTCHVDLPPYWSDLIKLHNVLNDMLPPTIIIKSIHKVSNQFHARFSATKRLYRYIIYEGSKNPFLDDFVTFVEDIDFLTIEQNIKLFQGSHDFQYFMKTRSDTHTTTRTIYKAKAYRYKQYIVLTFLADGFLRSQIRMMVGALLEKNRSEIEELLSCHRKHPYKPARANGLYLAKVHYKSLC